MIARFETRCQGEGVRTNRLAGVLSGLCLLLSGCGGGGGDDAAGPTPLPPAVTISSASSVDVDSAAQFSSDLGSSSKLSFKWDFGDGSSSTEAQPSHQYATAGEFNVTLTVTNESGETRTAAFKVTASRTAMVKSAVCSGQAQAGWCWQRPLPVGNVIEDITFVDASNGWAVGGGGQMLKTSDGGLNWTPQASGVTARLSSVRFSNSMTGWAAGDNGTVLRTVDGGAHWTQQAAGFNSFGSTGTSLTIIDPSTAVLTSGYGEVRYTKNSGNDWLPASGPSPAAVAANGTLWYFAYYGGVLKSTDPAHTPVSVLPSNWGTSFQAASFVNDSHAWVFGTTYDSGDPATYYKPTLWRTVDGGATWSQFVPPSLGSSGYYSPTGFRFFSATNGWLLIAGTLYRTTDAGTTWSALTLPTPAGAVYAGEFIDDNTLALRGQDGAVWLTRDAGGAWTRLAVPGEATQSMYDALRVRITAAGVLLSYGSRTYLSADGGVSWQRVLGGAPEEATGALSSLWFFDAKKGLAVSDAGWLLSTADAGLTWTRRDMPNSYYYGGYASRLQFSSSTDGWMLSGGTGIKRTTDGGQSWWTSAGSIPDSSIVDFHFVDANRGFNVNYNGDLATSTDAGQTWTKLSTLRYGVAGLRFINANEGVVVGTNGYVARTADGGLTWSLRPSGVVDHLRRVMFQTATVGWAVGTSGTLIQTTDGGMTWRRIPVPTTADMNDVFFADALHGWAVGTGGAVVSTSDGGATWTLQPSGTNRNLASAYFVDTRTGWLGGEAGTVLATATAGH
ncbi:YCF48-related protein [Ideonella sp. BN130291]|uniref:YCF48-related protein n=1 Tax=Ideonella sp. BN130291 TaxID=3112940 RepID=UPI002E25D522|nr:YCF48-related protein [Ideonella sp. BN130291]